MNAMIEMTALRLHQPRPHAPASEVAAWYEHKARLHERLARLGGPDAGQEEAYAMAAHDHARRLLRAQPWQAEVIA
jgi:hypothetical protein